MAEFAISGWDYLTWFEKPEICPFGLMRPALFGVGEIKKVGSTTYSDQPPGTRVLPPTPAVSQGGESTAYIGATRERLRTGTRECRWARAHLPLPSREAAGCQLTPSPVLHRLKWNIGLASSRSEAMRYADRAFSVPPTLQTWISVASNRPQVPGYQPHITLIVIIAADIELTFDKEASFDDVSSSESSVHPVSEHSDSPSIDGNYKFFPPRDYSEPIEPARPRLEPLDLAFQNHGPPIALNNEADKK